jgi:hypothetical protein
MFGRSRQQFVVALLVLVALIVVWGCGGGDKTTTSSSKPSATTQRTVANTGASDLVGVQIAPTRDSPAEYSESYQTRPIVLLFYVPGNADDISVLDSLDRLKSAFPKYLFLVYDYKTPEAYGDLSTLFQVDYPPELILIDKAGVIQDIWNGYVDEGTLNQSLVNLGRD